MGNSASNNSSKELEEGDDSNKKKTDFNINSTSEVKVTTEGQHESSEAETKAATSGSYWSLLKNGYTELVNLIIRPPRAKYDISLLGPTSFQYCNRSFHREDITLTNSRALPLQCSHWSPIDSERPAEQMPCLIYLHGNSSCRAEAIGVLRLALSSGMTVFAFDFAGCGKSGGQYISLGFYERDDLHVVTTYLRSTNRISTIGLWGRSMGAATALLHADRDPSIAAMVLDSAFTDLEVLAQEMVSRGREEGYVIPGFIVKAALRMIRSTVLKRAGFDLRKIVPIKHADRSFIPAMFVAATEDHFIGMHHSKELFDAYGGEKNFIKVDGDHNSIRPRFLLDSAGIFLQRAMQVDESNTFPDSNTSQMAPWKSSMDLLHEREQQLMLEAYINSFQSAAANANKEDSSDASSNSIISNDDSSQPRLPSSDWPCPACTYMNSVMTNQCLMCETPYKEEVRIDNNAKTTVEEQQNKELKPAAAEEILSPNSISLSNVTE